MKKVTIKEEGLSFNGSRFGDAYSIIHEAEYFIELLFTIYEIEAKLYYRLTDDGYIQYISYDNEVYKHAWIVGQFLRTEKELKHDLRTFLKLHAESKRFYEGLPQYNQSDFFTQDEYNAILDEIDEEYKMAAMQAKLFKTPLIAYLEEAGLEPIPQGSYVYGWNAKCPNSKGKHFIMVSTKYNTWGCGWCCKKGAIDDLKNWITEIKNKNKK